LASSIEWHTSARIQDVVDLTTELQRATHECKPIPQGMEVGWMDQDNQPLLRVPFRCREKLCPNTSNRGIGHSFSLHLNGTQNRGYLSCNSAIFVSYHGHCSYIHTLFIMLCSFGHSGFERSPVSTASTIRRVHLSEHDIMQIFITM